MLISQSYNQPLSVVPNRYSTSQPVLTSPKIIPQTRDTIHFSASTRISQASWNLYHDIFQYLNLELSNKTDLEQARTISSVLLKSERNADFLTEEVDNNEYLPIRSVQQTLGLSSPSEVTDLVEKTFQAKLINPKQGIHHFVAMLLYIQTILGFDIKSLDQKKHGFNNALADQLYYIYQDWHKTDDGSMPEQTNIAELATGRNESTSTILRHIQDFTGLQIHQGQRGKILSSLVPIIFQPAVRTYRIVLPEPTPAPRAQARPPKTSPDSLDTLGASLSPHAISGNQLAAINRQQEENRRQTAPVSARGAHQLKQLMSGLLKERYMSADERDEFIRIVEGDSAEQALQFFIKLAKQPPLRIDPISIQIAQSIFMENSYIPNVEQQLAPVLQLIEKAQQEKDVKLAKQREADAQAAAANQVPAPAARQASETSVEHHSTGPIFRHQNLPPALVKLIHGWAEKEQITEDEHEAFMHHLETSDLDTIIGYFKTLRDNHPRQLNNTDTQLFIGILKDAVRNPRYLRNPQGMAPEPSTDVAYPGAGERLADAFRLSPKEYRNAPLRDRLAPRIDEQDTRSFLRRYLGMGPTSTNIAQPAEYGKTKERSNEASTKHPLRAYFGL